MFTFKTGGKITEWVEVLIAGHGTKTAMDEDAPIYIEVDRETGDVTLYVYADINVEDPTHIIPLKDAKLSNRKNESRSMSLE